MGQIEDYRLFVQVVDHESISRAADHMAIAKSAVSRRLRLLEDRLESILIDRTPGAWAVTAKGAELYRRAKFMLAEADEIEADLGPARHAQSGPLNVAIALQFGIGFLTPALTAFAANHPEIQLKLDFDDRIIDLHRENYDLAVRVASQPPPGHAIHWIGTTGYALCAAPSYLETHGAPQTPADLRSHAILGFGADRHVSWTLHDSSARPQTLKLPAKLTTNNGGFLHQSALAGLGIARLPNFIAAPSIASGALIPLLTNFTCPALNISVLHAETRRINRRMRHFITAITTACSVNAFGIAADQR
jgi:DNA-binding transcriptional LysR family regulator